MPLIKITIDGVAYAVEPTESKPSIKENRFWVNNNGTTRPDFELLKVANQMWAEDLLSLPRFPAHPDHKSWLERIPDYSEVRGEKQWQILSGTECWITKNEEKYLDHIKTWPAWADRRRVVIVPDEGEINISKGYRLCSDPNCDAQKRLDVIAKKFTDTLKENYLLRGTSQSTHANQMNLTPNRKMCPKCSYIGDDFIQVSQTTYTPDLVSPIEQEAPKETQYYYCAKKHPHLYTGTYCHKCSGSYDNCPEQESPTGQLFKGGIDYAFTMEEGVLLFSKEEVIRALELKQQGNSIGHILTTIVPFAKSLRASHPTPAQGEAVVQDEFIQKHLAIIREKINDALIRLHIEKMWGGLEMASVQYFIETGTVNGGFRDRLKEMLKGAYNWNPTAMEEYARQNSQTDFLDVATQWQEWSVKTFKNAGAISTLKKLRHELKELIEEAENDMGSFRYHESAMSLIELADCFLCLLHVGAMLECGPDRILSAIRNKANQNYKREWIENPDHTYSHKK